MRGRRLICPQLKISQALPTLLACMIVLQCTTVEAAPVETTSPADHIIQKQRQEHIHQQAASALGGSLRPGFLNAGPQTVGMTLMTSEENGVHVWLPLEETVFVSHSWVLPAQPLTAEITGFYDENGSLGRSRALGEIVCRATIFQAEGEVDDPEEEILEFRNTDSRVNVIGRHAFVAGRAVESYKCSRSALSSQPSTSPMAKWRNWGVWEL